MSDSKSRSRPRGTGERLYKQLPREIAVRPSGRTVLLNLLVPLVVFLVTNFALLWYLDRYTTNRGYWLLEQKWEMLQAMSEPVDWLVVGDSSGNQGVVPEVWQDELNEKAVNLCTIGGTAALDGVWMIEEYIARFGAPENILIVHTYDAWYRDLEPILLAKIPLPWGYWNRYEPTPALSVEDRLNIFLGRYVPLYAETVTIGDVLVLAVESPDNLFKNSFHLEPDGYMPALEADPQYVKRDLEWHLDLVEKNNFRLAEVNRASLEQVITLAERYHVNVYIANGPIYEGLYGNEDFQEYISEVRKALGEFAEQSAYVHYLPALSVFPDSQMEDVAHVIHPAAERYTEILAAEIANVR
jgi:hypothetical protein